MHNKKILLAVVPGSISLLKRALDEHYDLIFCTTIEETPIALQNNIDLIIAGLQFNECQMFGFQQMLMLDDRFSGIPFISIKSINCGKVTNAQIRSIASASKVLGAADFINLYELIKEIGEERAFVELNSRIALVLNKKKQINQKTIF